MTTLTFRELGRTAWKRRWWFVVPVLLGLAAAFVAIEILPKVYSASTLVLVEPQKVPDAYVKATVTTTMGERLKTIEQQITNRSNIERIIEEMNLYPELRGQVSEEYLIEKVRRDLTLQVKGDSVFRIMFRGEDPKTIAATANRISELFIQENLRLRARQAQGTTAFLERELAETKQRLELQEARIAQFKQAYMGALPEQRDTNLRGVEQLQTKLQINLDALDKAEQRKILAQRELATWRPEAPPTTFVMPSAPRAPSPLEVARTELSDLLSRYTERHPDVVRKREQIALLERQASEIVEEPAAPLPSPAAPAPVNPILRAQLDAIDLEIRGLQAENARILTQISSYQGRLESVPRVEQQLLSLTRDYENIRSSYESLLAKRIDANLAENLEQTQQSEQFTILEKAIPPTQPVEPNLLLLLAAGLLGGILLGAVLALLREQTDPTYGDVEHFREAFPGVSVLATIPRLGGSTGRAPLPMRRAAAGGRR
jgi:polysaccharide chain length determinant protein (PEP-CTERM system associated)